MQATTAHLWGPGSGCCVDVGPGEVGGLVGGELVVDVGHWLEVGVAEAVADALVVAVGLADDVAVAEALALGEAELVGVTALADGLAEPEAVGDDVVLAPDVAVELAEAVDEAPPEPLVHGLVFTVAATAPGARVAPADVISGGMVSASTRSTRAPRPIAIGFGLIGDRSPTGHSFLVLGRQGHVREWPARGPARERLSPRSGHPQTCEMRHEDVRRPEKGSAPLRGPIRSLVVLVLR